MNQQWPGQPRTPASPAPQLPIQPQPFPGAQPLPPISVRPNPTRQREQERADIRTDIDVEANARAQRDLVMREEKLAQDRKKFEDEQAALAAKGGLETTIGEDQAGSHVLMLETSTKTLDRIARESPRDLAPTWFEKGVSVLTGKDPDFTSLAQNENRQMATAAYKNAIQSAIWISTGAAAPEEQVNDILQSIMPNIGDLNNPNTLRFKRQVLQGYIEAAKTRAGAANPKVLQALERLESALPTIYGANTDPSALAQPGEQQFELSGEGERVQIPAQMQQEYEAWLRQRPPGTLDVDEYLRFYEGLANKYEFGLPQSSIESAKSFVDAYNQGQAGLTIPNPTRELGEGEKFLASLGADKGLVGDVYTGTATAANAAAFGVPEYFAGREGREAFRMAQEANPEAALTGEILGSLLPTSAAERGAFRVIQPLVDSPVTGRVLSEVAGNAAYGAARGYTGAEPENRNMAAVAEGTIGAVSPLASRAAIRGVRGFAGEETTQALDALRGSTFEIPAARGALPADDITPPRFQAMSGEELRAEVARARAGVDAWGTQARIVSENKAAAEAIRQEAAQTAAANRNRQEIFVRENFRSTAPQSIDAVRAEAARQFPTDVEAVLQQPAFADRLKALKNPSTRGMEPKEILEARAKRLEEYLAQDPTPRSGSIPSVDLTTAQRAGAGVSEEAIQGLPGVRGARENAMRSFNRQNSARVLARIGQELPDNIGPGTEANAYVNEQLNRAYNQLRPSIKGKIDNSFNTAVAALRKQGTSTQAKATLWADVEETLQAFRKPDGSFDGEGYRELSSRLRRYQEVWGNNNNPDTTIAMQDVARLAESVRKQAQALVNRANPAAGRRLKNLEGAWAHQMRIEAASRGAAKAEGGVYSPDQYLNAIERLDTSRNKASVARGKGFDQDYAQSARKIMGGTPAKKASAGQVFGTSAATAYIGAPAVALLGALGLSYTPGVKRLMQAIIDGRLGQTPDVVTRNLENSEIGKRILNATDADARQQLLQQLLRAKGAEAVDQNN